jgi:peptidoglycan/LPS O-acetylase OafA/YrhL
VSTPHEPGYRPDIEGLRGLSILLVVGAHAGVPWLRGGFVGVDVFFVISGFLITGLLARQLQRDTRIDFAAFYARRVRRLLPAFAVMIALVALATCALLPTGDWPFQARAAAWASLWASNIFFARADVDYFGAQREDGVLLHTWSLGVEEQFYLLWPLLLLGFWRAFGARSVWAVAAVALAGFVAGVIATRTAPIDAYYLLPFRLWQLAAGATAWYALSRRVPRGAGGVALAGGGGVAIAAVALSPAVAYPGVWALLPTLGAVALIVAGSAVRTTWIRRVLESAPLVWTGRVSYSWYLWHWPVLVLGATWAQQQAPRVAALVALSLLLAGASYALIERPTRALAIRRPWRWVVAGIGSALLLALAMLGWQQAAHRMLDAAAQDARADFEHRVLSTASKPLLYQQPQCDTWYLASELVPCRIGTGATPDAPLAIVIGDSVALQWFPALQAEFAQAGWNLVVLTKSSCPMVARPFFYERLKREFTECDEWRARAIEYVRAQRPALLLMGSSDGYPYSPEEWREGTRELLQQWRTHAARIAILAPTPVLPFLAPTCVVQQDAQSTEAELQRSCRVPLAQVEKRALVATLMAAADGLSNVSLLDFNDLACPDGTCTSWRDGQLVFRDDRHLNARYVERISERVGARLAPLMREAVDAAPR